MKNEKLRMKNEELRMKITNFTCRVKYILHSYVSF